MIQKILTQEESLILSKKFNTPISRPQQLCDEFHDKFYIVNRGKESDCWEWICNRNKKNYGTLKLFRKWYTAHRVMFQIYNPFINIDSLLICHHCDNPPCINPEHLYAGTNYDNVQDMVLRNRNYSGERHHNSSLTNQDLCEILNRVLNNEFKKVSDILDYYDADIKTVYHLINGRFRKDVTKDFDLVQVRKCLNYNSRIFIR